MNVLRFCLFIFIAFLPGCAANAQDNAATSEAPQVLRVNVRLVMVDAQVLSRKTGRAVSSLRAEDFQVYEDGVQQPITSFSQDELPLSVVFLFDLTDSVRPVLKSLASGALQALRRLKPEDEVAVMVYAASTQLLQDFTTDRELAAKAIEKASKMESPEAAFFNEGMFQAASQAIKSKNPSSRRVLLWMTDNVPNIPSEEIRARYGRSISAEKLHSKNEAMLELLKHGTVVYTLLRMSDISRAEEGNNFSHVAERMLYPPGDVYRYSEQTGGHVIEANTRNMETKLANWIDELRTRYTLGYHPPDGKKPGKFCKVQVKISPEIKQREGKVLIEAKLGYYR